MKRAWVATIVGYSVLRAVLAWGFLGEHGVNPWIFLAIDVLTAVPYATSTGNIPGNIVRGERRALAWNVVIAIVMFLAPYVYLWYASDTAPTDLRTGMAVLVLVLAAAAAIGVFRRIRNERKAELEAAPELAPTPGPTASLDLTEGRAPSRSKAGGATS